MDEMRCLMFGRVTESVWNGLMLKTMGTMSRSNHRRVQRLGAYGARDKFYVIPDGPRGVMQIC